MEAHEIPSTSEAEIERLLFPATKDLVDPSQLTVLQEFRLMDLAMFKRKIEIDGGGGTHRGPLEALAACVESVHEMILEASR